MAIKIQSGVQKCPQKLVVYGPEGVGKTTLAAAMPSPLFADCERGTTHIDLSRVEINDIGDFRESCMYLIREQHDFKSFVVDTADWLATRDIEEMLKDDSQDSIEDYGYGKGYKKAEERFMGILNLLERVSKKGIHIVLLAHSKIVKFEEPDKGGSYDRYELKCEKKIVPLIKEWCDALLFLNFETRLVEQSKGSEKKRGVGGNNRILHCVRAAAYDAKNRHGLAEKVKAEIKSLAPIFSGTVAEKEVEPTVEEDREPAARPKDGSESGLPEGKVADKAKNEALAARDADPNDGKTSPNESLDEAFALVVERAGGRDAVQAFLAQRDLKLVELDESYKERVVASGDTFAKQVAERSKAAVKEAELQTA